MLKKSVTAKYFCSDQFSSN